MPLVVLAASAARRCATSLPRVPAVAVTLRQALDARNATSSWRATASSPSGRVRLNLMQDTKVSSGNSADALFQESINQIRAERARLERDPVFQNIETGAITKLKQDELELTRKIFARVDPTKDITSNLRHQGHDIDPYWNPFQKVQTAREQVTADFDEYAKLVSVAEQKRIRIQIKKSLRRCSMEYNPYSPEFKRLHERASPDSPPKPFRLPDQYWERTPLQEQLNRERITFRDVDIIQHFIADNGYILPRRTTTLTRKKQKFLVKAVKTAQCLSLIPYGSRSQDYQAMPLMDPLQWMADRLTDRVMDKRDKRSRVMVEVMMERYPELNYHRFLKHKAARASEA